MTNSTVSKKSKLLLWILVSTVVIGVAAQLFFSHKVKSLLVEQIPENFQLQYNDLSTNVFLGNIALEKVELNTTDGKTQVLAHKIEVKGIGYLSLLSKKTVELGEVHLEKPKILLKQQPSDTLKEPASVPENTPKLLIKKFKVDQGGVTLRDASTDSLILEAKAIDINLAQLELNPQPEPRQPPFTLETYEVAAHDLYFNVSPLEFMRTEQLQLSNASGTLENLIFKSKYSQQELVSKIRMQHDHYNVHIDEIQITQPDLFGTSGPKLRAPLMEIKSPLINVHRNSLLPPNTIIKKMPNQMLREMTAELKIDSISVTDGEVNFYKKTLVDVEPKKMALTNLQSQIKNLNSTGDGIVTVTAQHQIMDDGNFNLEYTFDP